MSNQIETSHLKAVLDFAASSPVLTFFLFGITATTIANITKALTRSYNLRKHGWPPPHLDADGDFEPEPEPENPTT